MPFLFRGIRRDSVIMGRVRQYFWYAIGEVVLIFFGITLALAFDDWSQERQLHEQQVASLQDLAENLRRRLPEPAVASPAHVPGHWALR